MNQIKNTDDIKQLGTILCVWAHPDDESFSCAGIMAAAIQNGQQIACVTATKGEAGVQDESRWPAAKLGEIRAHEMHDALDIIGCHDHHWLDYHDGHCQEVSIDESIAKIKDFINQIHPNTILTFGPDGMTGHPDHQTVSKWVDEAVKDTDIQVFHTVEEKERYEKYMIELTKSSISTLTSTNHQFMKEVDLDIAFNLPPDILFKKRLALKAMPSQTERMFKNTSSDMMNAMLAQECFVLRRT